MNRLSASSGQTTSCLSPGDGPTFSMHNFLFDYLFEDLCGPNILHKKHTHLLQFLIQEFFFCITNFFFYSHSGNSDISQADRPQRRSEQPISVNKEPFLSYFLITSPIQKPTAKKCIGRHLIISKNVVIIICTDFSLLILLLLFQ